MLNGLVSLSISFTLSAPWWRCCHCRWQQEIRYSFKQSWPSNRCATSHCIEEAEGNNGGKEPGEIYHLLHSISQSVPLGDSRKIMIKSVAWLTWLPAFRTVTWSSTGCQTASVKNVMTAMKSSPLSDAATIADCVVRFSAVAAATRKSLESSWVTQVSAVPGHKSLSNSKLINGRTLYMYSIEQFVPTQDRLIKTK